MLEATTLRYVRGLLIVLLGMWEQIRVLLCDMPTSKLLVNCPFRSSNGEWGRVLNFHLIKNWSPNKESSILRKKDHIKMSQFTKFEVLSLDCNHV